MIEDLLKLDPAAQNIEDILAMDGPSSGHSGKLGFIPKDRTIKRSTSKKIYEFFSILALVWLRFLNQSDQEINSLTIYILLLINELLVPKREA